MKIIDGKEPRKAKDKRQRKKVVTQAIMKV